MAANIDNLTPTRSLIDLASHSNNDFGLDDFELSFIFDDIMLVEYIDTSSDGDSITRNGIYIPANALTKAWRKARVILVGPNVKYTKKDDIVVFPNNLGITVSNLKVKDYGVINKGIFLNENRVFGICKKIENDDA